MSAYSIRKNEDGKFVVVHEYDGPVAVFDTDREASAFCWGADKLLLPYWKNDDNAQRAYLMGQKETR